MNEVLMPPRIAALPRDARGFPVPWNILWVNGVPNFAINDSMKHIQAVTGCLCPICGESLGKWKWFVGGPKSAFDPNGWYIDLPGHVECIEYALQVCPYLSVRNYHRETPLIERVKIPEGHEVLDETQDPTRPLLFVMVATAMVEIMPRIGQLPVVRPRKPWLGIKFWRHGQELSREEGEALARQIVPDLKIEIKGS